MKLLNKILKKENRPITQEGRILKMLQDAGSRGVENHKLASYNLGYRSRITELRQDGYNIFCERQTLPNGKMSGVWKYYLTEES